MKVLYIHQYYRKPRQGGCIRSYNLAKGLVQKGVEVEIISAHNSDRELKECIDGITVHYLPVMYDNKLSFQNRIKSYLRFVYLTIRKSYSIQGVDLCYVMTTPLTTGLIALWMKVFRQIPYIFEVGDLWPLVPVEMGIVRNPITKVFLFWFERMCYRSAIGIVALSPAIAEYISSKVPFKPIETIPNIADIGYFQPGEKRKELKKKYGINNEFVISYTGTLGLANHLEYLLEAAKTTREFEITYLIVGDGAEKEKLVAIKEQNLLTKVVFLSSTDKAGIEEIMNISDAVYVSFANFNALATGSPNKLFDGLAAGKLITSNFNGWIKKLIESNDAGFSYDPDRPDMFADKILLFISNKEILKSFQKNARQLAENSFSLEELSKKQIEFIKSVTNSITRS